MLKTNSFLSKLKKQSSFLKGIFLISFGLLFAACSESSSETPDQPGGGGNSNNDEIPVTLGQAFDFEFAFKIRLYDESLGLTGQEFRFQNDRKFTVPLYVKKNGNIALRAVDFPSMVTRICRSDSELENCDSQVDSEDFPIPADLDIVVDVCPKEDAEKCGTTTKQYNGGNLIAGSGEVQVNSIEVRIRIFAADTFDKDEYPNIESDDEAAIPAQYIIAAIQTGTVLTGNMTEVGTPLSEQAITFVAGGILPPETPVIDGAEYISIMEGQFIQSLENYFEEESE